MLFSVLPLAVYFITLVIATDKTSNTISLEKRDNVSTDDTVNTLLKL